MSTDLFQPCRIGQLELSNRWVRSATWDATADSTGAVTDESVALYRELPADAYLVSTTFGAGAWR